VDADSCPWEDPFVKQRLDFASCNPYHVPEIQQLLDETSKSPNAPGAAWKCTDVFAGMPLEIITAISMYLPTVDYLNTRLALPSFYPVFYTQKFWASRFLPYAERSWIFESPTGDMTCDWLWLYRCTVNGSPGMKNRKRIWQVIEKIRGILDLEWIEPILYSPTDSASLEWLEAACDLRLDGGRYFGVDGGCCRRFHERSIHVSSYQFSQVAFSLIQPGNVTYITGIKFISNREAVHLGYMAHDERVQDITNLTGFHVAIGSRGVQAIQCVIENGRVLPWVGSPEHAPMTKRLSLDGPLSGIKAGFDVSSILSSVTDC
jgi:hypothetical protein